MQAKALSPVPARQGGDGARRAARAQGSTIRGCVIGNNIYVGDGCTLEDSLFLSSDFYTNDASRAASRAKGDAVLGVGARFPCGGTFRMGRTASD